MTERFCFLAYAWNITQAKRLAASRTPNARLDPRRWGGLLSLITTNDEHVPTVDLSEPLIAVPIPEAGVFVIDGWHRVALALRNRVTDLPVIVLTAEEELDCRIQGGDKPSALWFR